MISSPLLDEIFFGGYQADISISTGQGSRAQPSSCTVRVVGALKNERALKDAFFGTQEYYDISILYRPGRFTIASMNVDVTEASRFPGHPDTTLTLTVFI